METRLAENIRAFRKQRGLTQEQLAEVLGVTVGAVHKWEKKLSVPELGLITEMADFFDISVDVLLGYEMKDNSLKATLGRLAGYLNAEAPEGPAEAEKALKRFPNSFEIVYMCAVTFMVFGGKNHDEAMLNRAIEQLERSLLLMPQNTDRKISEIGIYAYIATAMIMTGRGEEAAELMKEHNKEGIYNDQIGMTLSLFCGKPEEAQPFLSEALLNALSTINQTVIGKAFAFSQCGDQDSAENLLRWGLNMLDGIRRPDTPGYLDQACSCLNTLLARVCLKKGLEGEAREALALACEQAGRFDAQPNYDARSFRYIAGAESFSLHILLGRTARESIAYIVRLIGDEALINLWKELTHEE